MKKLLTLLLLSFCLVGADTPPGFETQDLYGTTTNYSGTVGATAIAIPTVAGNVISEALIRMPTQSPNSRRLQVSFTSNTGPWLTLSPGEFGAWSVKGSKTQFWIIANGAGISYEIIVNYETY